MADIQEAQKGRFLHRGSGEIHSHSIIIDSRTSGDDDSTNYNKVSELDGLKVLKIEENDKISLSRGSTGTEDSDSSSSNLSTSTTFFLNNNNNINNNNNKPHKANDPRWEAIQALRIKEGSLRLTHFRLLKKLGCGDIGSVYLAELRGASEIGNESKKNSDADVCDRNENKNKNRCYFAMKVMDKASLVSRKKVVRAQTEREILELLDHPFLPSLYTHFDTEKFSCLVMEFCSGGDLHASRQRQPGKHFQEMAARFYAAEVLLSLEYLHMMGVIYRDLKPENVLVREDGHIMLSDFDLSLRCVVKPTLVKSAVSEMDLSKRLPPSYCAQPSCLEPSSINPSCVAQPSCFTPKMNLTSLLSKKKKQKANDQNHELPLPELVAEPTGARSLSFVGTHEYLAPEIIKGDGHGSAVDWWTFGIFLYELLYGKTPFKGSGNRATLFNVIGQPLKFPETPAVSFAARDLIRGLLVKDPQHRLAYKRGATEIKQHPFFDGVNWALIRSMTPPHVPKPFEIATSMKTNITSSTNTIIPSSSLSHEKKVGDADSKLSGSYLEFDFF